jgi:hypothetical protein
MAFRPGGYFVLQRPLDYMLLAEEESERAPDREDTASLLAALIYADLFDYPLTLNELVRYQVGTSTGAGQVAQLLDTELLLAGAISLADGYYALKGREEVFVLRQQRYEASARVWRRYGRYRKWIGRTPFVRMVAVTGALAMNNIGDRPDVDLMIVAQAGRVWICRRLLVLLVRVARLFGDELCPNYIISDAHLHLDQRDFFTAHELAQMVLQSGEATYLRLLDANSWARPFIPMAFTGCAAPPVSEPHGPLKSAFERFLGMKLFDRWEKWELNRLRSKLQPLIGHEAAEVVCSPDQCKGHTSHHRQFITARFRARLCEYGLDDIAQRFLADA